MVARRQQRAQTIGSVLKSTVSIALLVWLILALLHVLGVNIAPFIAFGRRRRYGSGIPVLRAAGNVSAVPALAVMAILGVFAVSELLLSPIGLSVTTKLARRLSGLRSWRCTSSQSASARRCRSGVLAGYYDASREVAYFGILGGVAVVAGVVVFAIAPWISSQMEGVD